MRFKPTVRQLLLDKSAREGRRIGQKEVAEATGLPLMTISRWMNTNGFLRFEAETAHKLAEYFEVQWNDLVELVEGDVEDPQKETYSTPIAIPA